ncbi:MAG: MFS transporter, partial [Chloroflexi bacterium]|nr:MFS transporter [Chloroflexota bacterium]
MARASLVPLALLSPLRHRSFALLWGGQACSHLGDSVSAVALPWLVYDLTDSPVAMATVLVLFSVATMLLLPVGGVLADRLARRRLMIFMDAVRGVAMATIAGLVAAGGIEIWHVQALAVVVG